MTVAAGSSGQASSRSSCAPAFRRADGFAKVTGSLSYGIDHGEPGMLHAKVLRSPVAAGRIARLDYARALELPGVRAIVVGEDIPFLRGATVSDQPALALDVVRYVGEPVLGLAADSEEVARRALELVVLEVETLPAVLELSEAIRPDGTLVHPDWRDYEERFPLPREGNLLGEAVVERGEVESAFAREDVTVVAGEYRTHRQSPGYIEPRSCVARWESGRYVVHTATQATYLVRLSTARALGVPTSAVRVVPTAIGGGFGGKGDASGLEAIACALARRAGRPVRIVSSRPEELATARSRANTVTKIRSAVTPAGEIVGREAEFIIDAGAYGNETAGINSIAPLVLAGNYRCGSYRIRCRAFYTNTPPTGSMRGITGVPAQFALERHTDEVAAALALDPREMRRRSTWVGGDEGPLGQRMPGAGFADVLGRLDREIAAAPLRDGAAGMLAGTGMGIAYWLALPGASGIHLSLADDGIVTAVTGAVEIGTGSVAAAIPRIVAGELGLRPEQVVVADSDTDTSPADAGAHGSRTLVHVGGAAESAAREMRRQLLDRGAAMLDADPAELALLDGRIVATGRPQASLEIAEVAAAAERDGARIEASARVAPTASPAPPELVRLAKGIRMTGFASPSFHAHLAQVSVDPETGKVAIDRYLVVQDVGHVIDRAGIEGQIYGGVVQAIGYVLLEELRTPTTGPLRQTFESYRLPTSFEAPPIEIHLLEGPGGLGPQGAKGVGEPPIVTAAGTIANAVSDAIGAPMNSLPLTPWRVLEAIDRAGAAALPAGSHCGAIGD